MLRLVRDPIVREFLLGFWKIHILHHAEQGVYGQWMLEELREHGYHISPGTLYPILSRMARRGWLRAAEPKRPTAARIYRLTPRGHEVLDRIRIALDELYGEMGAHQLHAHRDHQVVRSTKRRTKDKIKKKQSS